MTDSRTYTGYCFCSGKINENGPVCSYFALFLTLLNDNYALGFR